MKKPFIVAEIAQGYEGSEKLVELYVKAASAAGADAIKFHIFFADELALPDYKYYQLYKGLELPLEVWQRSVQESHARSLMFYSDVLGADSLRMLEKIGADGYKVHTTDINNYHLLKLIADTRKKVLLSTGGCQREEIDSALEIFRDSDVTLMYGFQAEPTDLEDNNLNRIRTLMTLYAKPVGFQDHTAGWSEQALYLPFLALGVGSEVIEKHLTLSRSAEIEDYISALTPEEFTRWTAVIKSVYRSLGQHEWELTKKEIQYRGKVRRAVCSMQEIQVGDIINEKQLTLKRTDKQNVLFDINDVKGKPAKRKIAKNTAIEEEDIL